METAHALALLAGAMNLYAFWRYNKDVFVGNTRPNAATWFLWAFVTAVQVASYKATGEHWMSIVVMGTDSACCILTFLFLLLFGKFGRLDKRSWQIIRFSAGAILLWQLTSASSGNVLSLIPYTMAFLPTIRDARDGRTIEDPWTWVIFTLSFVISLIVTAMSWSGRYGAFLFPVVAIVMHGALVYYAFRGRRLYIGKSVTT